MEKIAKVHEIRGGGKLAFLPAANANDSHFTGTGILHVRRSGLISPLRFILR